MERLWDAITTVIKMNDKVERLAGTVKTQQERIEILTERVIRLEATLDIVLASQGINLPPSGRRTPTLEHKG